MSRGLPPIGGVRLLAHSGTETSQVLEATVFSTKTLSWRSVSRKLVGWSPETTLKRRAQLITGAAKECVWDALEETVPLREGWLREHFARNGVIDPKSITVDMSQVHRLYNGLPVVQKIIAGEIRRTVTAFCWKVTGMLTPLSVSRPVLTGYIKRASASLENELRTYLRGKVQARRRRAAAKRAAAQHRREELAEKRRLNQQYCAAAGARRCQMREERRKAHLDLVARQKAAKEQRRLAKLAAYVRAYDAQPPRPPREERCECEMEKLAQHLHRILEAAREARLPGFAAYKRQIFSSFSFFKSDICSALCAFHLTAQCYHPIDSYEFHLCTRDGPVTRWCPRIFCDCPFGSRQRKPKHFCNVRVGGHPMYPHGCAHQKYKGRFQFEKIEHQMESDPTNVAPDSSTNIIASSNILGVEDATPQTVRVSAPTCWEGAASEGSEEHVSREMMSRYTLFDQFTWSGNDEDGKVLKTYEFPNALFESAFINMPNAMILKKFNYYQFDIKLKVSINATKFHTGKLICCWNYNFGNRPSYFVNRGALSQMPHAFISVPCINPVELVIPFKYVFPYWSLEDILNKDHYLRVYLASFNHLQATESVPNQVSVVVQLQLCNIRVCGMSANSELRRLEIEHQMLGSLLGSVEGLLRNVLSDGNRDNPTEPRAHMAMIPYSSHSWSIGTNQNQVLNPLRLDPLAVTPHCNPTDEMRVSYIASHSGLLETFEWKETHNPGDLLWSAAVTPFNPLLWPNIKGDIIYAQMDQYLAPPVSVLASMFAYWRGSLKFEFSFVSNLFQSGRLAFVFVPKRKQSTPPTLNQAYNSYVLQFSLGEQTTFEYVCPYICNQDFLRCRSVDSSFPLTLKDVERTGTLYCYVVNKLVCVQGSPSVVPVNVFLSGGSDFQVALPCNPALAPSTLGTTYSPITNFVFTQSIPPFQLVADPDLPEPAEQLFGMKIVKETDDVEFQPQYDVSKAYFEFTPGFRHPEDPTKVVKFFVRYFNNPDRMILLGCKDEPSAKTYCLDSNRGDTFANYLWNVPNGETWAMNPPYAGYFSVHHILETQAGDERREDHFPVSFPGASSLTAQQFYNESFDDLKTLCRRFHLYDDTIFKLNKNTPIGKIIYRVPLNPAGFFYDYSLLPAGSGVREFLSKSRGSPMNILASCFRFFKGGLRCKLIFKSDSTEPLIISVSHIPDRVVVDKPSTSLVDSTENFSSQGYAYYTQSVRLNEIIEIECPYYLNSEYGVLCTYAEADPSIRPYISLGDLCVSIVSRPLAELNVVVEVYVAFADDMRFSSFQGFPLCVSPFLIPSRPASLPVPPQLSKGSEPEQIEHQMFTPRSTVAKCTSVVFDKVAQCYDGARDRVTADIKTAIAEGAAEPLETLNRLVDTTIESVDQRLDRAQSLVSTLCDSLRTAGSELYSLAVVVVSNCIHVCRKPDVVSIIVAISAIFMQILNHFGFSIAYDVVYDFFKYLVGKIGDICAWFRPRDSIEHQDDKLRRLSLIDVCKQYGKFLASIFSFSGCKDKSWPNFFSHFALNMSKMGPGIESIIDFVKFNIDILHSCVDWLLMKTTGTTLERFMYSYPSEFESFIEDAVKLTNPLHRDSVMNEPYLQRRVFRVAHLADRINMYSGTSSQNQRASIYVRDVCARITKLRAELVSDVLCPMARFEPYVLQINGPSKIGKSFIARTISRYLLQAINYKCTSDPVYERCAGVPYWNGVRNQPIVHFDDFMCMRSGEFNEVQVAELMMLKSCASFNPNIAELENKKIRLNPIIVLLSSNSCFWQDPCIRHPEALHRRRDGLWDARIKEGYSMDQVIARFRETKELTFDHLEFCRYPNPTVQRTDEQWMPFEGFVQIICQSFRAYYQAESEHYARRITEFDALLPAQSALQYDEDAEKQLLKVLSDQEEASIATEGIADWMKQLRSALNADSRTIFGAKPVVHQADEPTPSENPGPDPVLRECVPLWFSDSKEFAHHNLPHDPCEHCLSPGSPRACMRCRSLYNRYNGDGKPRLRPYFDENSGRMVPSDNLFPPPCDHYFHADVPYAFQCIHYHSLSVYHRYTCDIDDQFLESEEDLHFVYRYDDYNTGKGYLVPIECSAGPNGCYLNSEYALPFIRAYVEFQYSNYFKSHGEVDPDLIAPFARKYLAFSNKFSLLKKIIDVSSAVTLWSKNKFFKIFEFLSSTCYVLEVLSGILSIGIAAGAAYALPWVYKKCIGKASKSAKKSKKAVSEISLPDREENQMICSSGNKIARKSTSKALNAKSKVKKVSARKFKVKHQSSVAGDQLISAIRRNSFVVRCCVSSKSHFCQRGLALCSRYVISTRHFIEAFRALLREGLDAYLRFEFDNYHIDVVLNDIQILDPENGSLVILELPSRINLFKNIIPHIATEDDLVNIGKAGTLFIPDGKVSRQVPVNFDVCEELVIPASGPATECTIPMSFEYSYGGKGLCGSVLINTEGVCHIIGFHVAGSNSGNLGYSEAVTREQFDELVVISQSVPKVLNHNMTDDQADLDLPYNTVFVGLIDPENKPLVSSSSEIIRSIAYDQIYPHETEPAVLRLGDPRVVENPDVDPIVKAIQTHGNVPSPFVSSILSDCADDLYETLVATSPPVLAVGEELLSDQQIFSGVAGIDGYNGLNIQSSEGFPLCLERYRKTDSFKLFKDNKVKLGLPTSGKSWLFDYETTEVGNKLKGLHPKLSESISLNSDLRSKGVVPATIFVDTLKDSRVSREKVQAGKTRMFSISPVEYTWAIKKYYGHFQAAYQQGRINNGTAIGINVRGQEWATLAKSLLKVGDKFIVGDYKSFGDTLERSVMLAAFSVIHRWYIHFFASSQCNQAYRDVLVLELFNALHLCRNVLYRMQCGIPSGFALTVEINDLVNQLYMRYCWKCIVNRSFVDYHKLVKVVTYGDDIIISCHDDIVEHFNFKSIQNCLANYHIQFQPASKDDSSYHFMSFWKVTFLKAYFVKHPNRKSQFLAKLPLSSCLDSLNWQIGKRDRAGIMIENARASLLNLFGHGPDTYSLWRSKINDWFAKAVNRGIYPKGHNPIKFLSWSEMDLEVYDQI
nr:MAG: polyprotein [Iflaviridae sp.]